MPDAAVSLQRHFPRHVDVPLGLLASAGLLVTGLFLPVMRVEKLIFWEDDYSILTGGITMLEQRNYVLAVVLLGFSVLFPLVKLITTAVVWFVPTTDHGRSRILKFVSFLGKWSMLDVFVVAVMVVLTQSKATLDVRPQIGLYIFAGAIILSMLVTIRIERLAMRSAQRAAPSPTGGKS